MNNPNRRSFLKSSLSKSLIAANTSALVGLINAPGTIHATETTLDQSTASLSISAAPTTGAWNSGAGTGLITVYSAPATVKGTSSFAVSKIVTLTCESLTYKKQGTTTPVAGSGGVLVTGGGGSVSVPANASNSTVGTINASFTLPTPSLAPGVYDMTVTLKGTYLNSAGATISAGTITVGGTYTVPSPE